MIQTCMPTPKPKLTSFPHLITCHLFVTPHHSIDVKTYANEINTNKRTSFLCLTHTSTCPSSRTGDSGVRAGDGGEDGGYEGGVRLGRVHLLLPETRPRVHHPRGEEANIIGKKTYTTLIHFIIIEGRKDGMMMIAKK